MLSRNLNIEEFLKETANLIDRKIEEYIPRRFMENSLIFKFSPPRYPLDFKALAKAVSNPIWDFLDRGGKRWRPALFLLVLEGLGGDREKYFDFAIIPEVIHNGTLIADDIEDNSVMRRGKPCTHRIFGVDIAINVSNALYYLPMLVLRKKRDVISTETANKIYEIYIQEMINLSFGQAMDIVWHRGVNYEVTEEQYIQMCMYKTGTLARMAARMAAVLAGSNGETVELMGRFAESIGVSFQIQDDILDIVGSEFAKGKGGLGMDITEGKRSLMVIYTLSRATSEDRERLISILNLHTKDENLKKEAISILKKYGSIKYAREVAGKLKDEGLRIIDEVMPPSWAKDMLISLTNYLVERKI